MEELLTRQRKGKPPKEVDLAYLSILWFVFFILVCTKKGKNSNTAAQLIV